MNAHRHVPASWAPIEQRVDSSVCLRCGQDIVRIAETETRAGHWRAVRRVVGRSVRSVSPRPATVDNDGWSEAEMREAYGR